MSIKFIKVGVFSLTLVLFSFFSSLNSFAAIGYEKDTGFMVDTMDSPFDKESFVIGNDIQYYDFHNKGYRNGFVIFVDYTSSGLKVEVKEQESQESRTFFIDYED